LKSKIFTKLFGLFLLLLVFQAAAMEFVVLPFIARQSTGGLRWQDRLLFWQ
jgi:hypothetical protein